MDWAIAKLVFWLVVLGGLYVAAKNYSGSDAAMWLLGVSLSTFFWSTARIN